jgi:tetratricopeptide (TPR) repeat protein
MHFVIKLESLTSRAAALFIVLAIGIVLLWLICSHFVVRVVADPRLVLSREALAAAALHLPDSARVHLRQAEAELSVTGDYESARLYATRAVELSPADFQAWQALAMAQEGVNMGAEAVQSLQIAAQLAPRHSGVGWALANLFLRRSELDEAAQRFRDAAKVDRSLYPAAFDLLWQASNRDLAKLKAAAEGEEEARSLLAQFLLARSLTAEAADVFRGIDREARLRSPRSGEFINSLINNGQMALARALWLDSISGRGGAEGVWNGSFETEPVKGFEQFDWNLSSSDHARPGIDRDEARTGARSLKLMFTGRDTTRLQGEVKQLIVVRPGARYRLECYAKASNLVTPEGPRLSVMKSAAVIASSKPVAAGASDWQRLVVDFVAPSGTSSLFVTVTRLPRLAYDNPTRGTIWFDDFSLKGR